MKFKRFLASFCLVLSLVFLTSCGGINLEQMPAIDATVYGNGGTSVVKGDYVYFVNSYTSYSNLEKNDNNNGEVKVGAIYRTKLKDGKVEYNNDVVQNYEMVVSKVVGYEYTNLYIFDDYIYYPTPNMEYSKDGTLNTKAIDFCRTKLDGSRTDILYTAKNYDDTCSYEFYKIGNSVYLVVFEVDKLVKVEISNHVKGAEILVENITGAIMPKISTYTHSNDVQVTGTQGYVYYTRDFSIEEDNAYDTSNITGNVLGRVSIADGKRTERKSADIKYGLQIVSNDYIFVTKGVDIYAIHSSFPTTENELGKQDIRISHSVGESLSISNFYTLKNGTGYIYSLNDKTYYCSNILNGKTYEIASKALTILGDSDNYVYYTENSAIYRISLVPTYINEKEFTLEASCTIGGVAKNAGDIISAKTIISEAEYFALTNAIDKSRFTKNTTPELIVEDSTIDTKYMDFSQENVIYYFATYTGKDSESQVYMKRVVVSPDNKVLPEEDEEDEENTNEDTNADKETNLGYNAELLCVLDDKHKPVETK